MTKTTTTYEIHCHDYTELTPCTTPATCTTRSHWSVEHETSDVDEARGFDHDMPAMRIRKVVTTRTTEWI